MASQSGQSSRVCCSPFARSRRQHDGSVTVRALFSAVLLCGPPIALSGIAGQRLVPASRRPAPVVPAQLGDRVFESAQNAIDHERAKGDKGIAQRWGPHRELRINSHLFPLTGVRPVRPDGHCWPALGMQALRRTVHSSGRTAEGRAANGQRNCRWHSVRYGE
jgi:hypothetical protein